MEKNMFEITDNIRTIAINKDFVVTYAKDNTDFRILIETFSGLEVFQYSESNYKKWCEIIDNMLLSSNIQQVNIKYNESKKILYLDYKGNRYFKE
jgi:hypothetical protein